MSKKSQSTSRLKFSRLCLSQNRALNASGKPPASSQISRFFTNASATSENSSHSIIRQNEEKVDVPISVVAEPMDLDNCDTNSRLERPSTSSHSPTSTRSNHSRLGHTTNSTTNTTIKSFFNNEDNLSDFEIPEKIMRKPPKKKPPARCRAKQSDIRNAIKRSALENAIETMSEEQQLQMALVISKNNCGGDIESQLAQFASTSNVPMAGLFNMKRKATKKHKWNSRCTQLTQRNEIAQERKIHDKIDEILVNNITVEASTSKNMYSNQVYIMKSRKLHKYCMSEQILYELSHSTARVEDNIHAYYTNNLVQKNAVKAGVLLKSWSEIPGRDAIYDDTRFSARKRYMAMATKEMDKIVPAEDDLEVASVIQGDLGCVTSAAEPNWFEPNSETLDSLPVNENLEENNSEENTAFSCNSQKSLEVIDEAVHQTLNDTQLKEKFQSPIPETSMASNKHLDINLNVDAEEGCDRNKQNETSDNDRTIGLDCIDIQLTVDTLNSHLRSSQQFIEEERTIIVNIPSSTSRLSRSPDLFADEDFFDSDPENRELTTKPMHCKQSRNTFQAELSVQYVILDPPVDDEKSPVLKRKHENVSSEVEAELDPELDQEVAPILEPEPEILLHPKLSPDLDPELKQELVPELETIIISSNESTNRMDQMEHYKTENILPEIIEIPSSNSTIGSAVDAPERETSVQDNVDLLNEIEMPSQNSCENTSDPNLSFNELQGLCEYDFLNNVDASAAYSQLSQKSAEMSDDEINYSMNIGSVKHQTHRCNDSSDKSNPIELNEIEIAPANESDENLVSRSICDILEKSFVHNTSITQTQQNHSIRIGGKSIKRIYSESAIPNNTPTQKSINFKPSVSSSSENVSQSSSKMVDLSNDEYIIQVGTVSAKPNYDTMDSIDLELELRKFGLKPSLKRRQAIICLEYIYNRTHPTIENPPDFVAAENVPVPRTNVSDPIEKQPILNFNIGFATHNLTDDKFKASPVDKVFLPSQPRAKKPWCLEPLHIAWHNLIKANVELRKTVLKYEPINLQELKLFFKSIEMTFDNRDLIAFLDLHCITFRMNSNTKL